MNPVPLAAKMCLMAIAGVVSCAAWSFAQKKPALDPVTAKAFEKVIPSDPGDRVLSYLQAKRGREQTIGGLLMLIHELQNDLDDEDETAASRVQYAIKTLGLMRAEEATEALLELIDRRFRREGSLLRRPTDPDVVQALARIGKMASKAAVGCLAKDKSSKRAPMYLRVIYLVEGAEAGKFMVQQAGRQEPDPARKERLEKALELFAKAEQVVQ